MLVSQWECVFRSFQRVWLNFLAVLVTTSEKIILQYIDACQFPLKETKKDASVQISTIKLI